MRILAGNGRFSLGFNFSTKDFMRFFNYSVVAIGMCSLLAQTDQARLIGSIADVSGSLVAASNPSMREFRLNQLNLHQNASDRRNRPSRPRRPQPQQGECRSSVVEVDERISNRLRHSRIAQRTLASSRSTAFRLSTPLASSSPTVRMAIHNCRDFS